MIEVSNLTKSYNVYDRREGLRGSIKDLFSPRYKTIEAIKNVSFNVEAGEILGYIGTNGAGKSTTIKLLSGILTPTSGEVKINGLIPSKERRKNAYNISVVFGQRTQLSWDLAVYDSYELIKNIYDVKQSEFDEKLAWINKIIDFKPLMHLPVRKLSLGQRMLCEIVASFINNPKVIFLDEPTIGLDIFVKEQVQFLIKQANKEFGTTFVITTHDMNDIDKLCSRIILIDKGELIFNGNRDEINELYGSECIVSFKSEDIFSNNYVQSVIPDNVKCKVDSHSLEITFNPSEVNIKSLIQNIFDKFNSIIDINVEKASLEYLIKKIYETRK